MKDKLQDLVTFVRDTDLTEVFWQQKNASITLRRSGGPAQPAAVEAPAPAAASAAAPGADASASAAPQAMVIRSTMVGTFFRSDAKKDRPPLVIEGTIVTAGQPVGCVEAMKIMKDVLSTQPCKIVKALVENGHAVEYGQPLFEVAPVDGAA